MTENSSKMAEKRKEFEELQKGNFKPKNIVQLKLLSEGAESLIQTLQNKFICHLGITQNLLFQLTKRL